MSFFSVIYFVNSQDNRTLKISPSHNILTNAFTNKFVTFVIYQILFSEEKYSAVSNIKHTHGFNKLFA